MQLDVYLASFHCQFYILIKIRFTAVVAEHVKL